MQRLFRPVLMCLVLLASPITGGPTLAGEEETPQTVEARHPGLASDLLARARLAELPEGVLLRCDALRITNAEVEKAIMDTPDPLRAALRSQAFYVLEREAISRVLPIVARRTAERDKTEDKPRVRDYLERVTAHVQIEEAAVARFYEGNKEVFQGASLDSVRAPIQRYLLEEKRELVIAEHLRSLGQSLKIEVAEDWTDGEALKAMDNPLDKARRSGKPALVAFSGKSCCGPDRVRPALEAMDEEFEGMVQVVCLDAREHELLAQRQHVRAIPTVILYDRDGREAIRQSGFFSRASLEQSLRTMEIK